MFFFKMDAWFRKSLFKRKKWQFCTLKSQLRSRLTQHPLISLLISWRLFLSSRWWMMEFASQQVNMFDTSLIYCTAFATAKNNRQMGIQSQNNLENRLLVTKEYEGRITCKNNIYSGLMCSINIFFANGSLQGTNTYFICLPFHLSNFRFPL